MDGYEAEFADWSPEAVLRVSLPEPAPVPEEVQLKFLMRVREHILRDKEVREIRRIAPVVHVTIVVFSGVIIATMVVIGAPAVLIAPGGYIANVLQEFVDWIAKLR